uniref:Uncharacterized protein n=1 Tax=Oryza rufipogon TaxID=4529 RepID=A0A0E0PRU6_ORYRU
MQIALAGNSKQRFLFQEFSSVLSRSMPNRPTSAEGGGVSAINNVFNGALRRFSTASVMDITESHLGGMY